ncbi:putative ribonuclease H-like domain-containing protein [Tanacetum coccineum]
MRMEQYLTHTDYALWEVIVNGDAPAITSTSAGTEGLIPPKTAEQKLVRKNELKAKSTLLLTILNEHLLKFHGIKDAKTLWEAIKARFGGNKESKKMQKTILKQQYENFTASRSEGLDKTYDRGKASSSNYADDVMFSFFANQSNASQLDNEDLEHIDADDLEEMDLKWAPRNQGNRNKDAPRRNAPVDTSTTNALVVQDGIGGYDWSFQAEEGLTNFALMAFTSQGSSSSDFEIIGYQIGLESLDSRIVVHEKNKAVYEENIEFLKYDVQVKDISIKDLKNQLEEALKEKDDLKLKLKKFEESSKNLTKLINSQISAKDKTVLVENEGFHVVPPPYTVNYIPSRPDLSFAGLDDSVYKTKMSETITTASKTNKDSLEKPKTIRPSAPIIEDWDIILATSISIARPVNTATPKSKVIDALPKTYSYFKAYSSARRGFNQKTAAKTNNLNEKVKTARVNNVTIAWPKQVVSAAVGNVENAIKHMTGNKSFLTDNQEVDGGFVAFAGSPKGARTMLADSLLPTTFWAEAVSTACYVQNRVLVTKPHNKTPYELLHGRPPSISFMRPFGCPVTILNTLNPLGKFDKKPDEGFFVGYSINSKAFRSSKDAVADDAGKKTNEESANKAALDNLLVQQKKGYTNITNRDSTVSPSVSAFGQSFTNADDLPTDPLMPNLEDTGIFSGVYDDDDMGAEADLNNLETTTNVSPIPTSRIHKDHPKDQIIGDSAFLYGTIEEEVYVCQPPEFEDLQFPDKVYKVEKALYGLHQAPRAWYETLSTYLLEIGFRKGTIDKTLFIKKDKGDILLVQGYVDGIIFGSTKKSLCVKFEQMMHKRFHMSSIGELTFFLGLQVKQKDDGIFISPDKYVADILKKFDFVTMKRASTPIETNKALFKDEEAKDVDVHLYRSMIGSLMYLTTSRPDIMFAVCACARFQVTPKVLHLHAVKRIFRYLKGQPKLGLWYPRDPQFDLEAFYDSDYAGASLDRKSTIGGCQFLSKRLISWQCKKKTLVANSTTKAEYVADANCCRQVLWIQNQMLDYGFKFMNTKIYIDNESTICIVKNLVFHSKSKHIEIRHHFIRDSKKKKLIQMIKIHINHNVADLLIKAFDVSRMEMAATTASSLEAEQDSGNINMTQFIATFNEFIPQGTDLVNILGSGKDNIKLKELIEFCTKLSVRTLDLCDIKTDKVNWLNLLRPVLVYAARNSLTVVRHKLMLPGIASYCWKKLRMKQRKDSGPTEPILDEATNEEYVATLFCDPPKSGDDRMQLTELMDLCTQLQLKVLALETTKSNQALEIESLKRRVKSLDKRRKSRTPGFKRLRKVGSASRVESSNDVNDLQGEEVVAEKEVAKKEVSAADPVTTAGEVVTTANAEVTTASAPTTTIDELTLA